MEEETLYIEIPIDFDTFTREVQDQIVSTLRERQIKYRNLAAGVQHEIKVADLVNPRFEWNIPPRVLKRIEAGLEVAKAPTSIRISGECPYERRKDGNACKVSVLVKCKPSHKKHEGKNLVSAFYEI